MIQTSSDHIGQQDQVGRQQSVVKKPLTEGKNLAEAENTPAYERKNVRLDKVVSSGETTLSRTRIFIDEENKLDIREENSFLHDNVD